MATKTKKFKINWCNVRITFTIIAVISFISLGVYCALNPGWPEPEQIQQVERGMSKEEVFELLGEKGWSEYDEDGFEYGWNFHAPNGVRQTFWVTINKKGIVTDIYTCY